jgi:predicted lipoprotein with Yx(FWY)xxD motif
MLSELVPARASRVSHRRGLALAQLICTEENTMQLLRTTVVHGATLLLSACGGSGTIGAPSTPPTLSATSPVVSSATMLSLKLLNGAPAFVNAQGLSVYVFDADLAAPGTSTCNGQADSEGRICHVVWPPVAPPAGIALTANFSKIKRVDGSTQLTYTGRPLYTFFGDSAAGQANGDGLNAFGGIWHLSRPLGSSTGTSPNPPTTPY